MAVRFDGGDDEAGDPFLFQPDSEMWLVNRERCGLIFGPAAAVLQVAHPRIAQGVFDHSDFRGDALGRLRRTLASTNRIAFGRRSEAEAIRARLASVHGSVRGEVAAGVKGGRRYSALEPELLVWVLATLVWAAVRGFEFVHGPLPAPRKEAFYRDMVRFGTWFGVREADCPSGWEAFEAYFAGMAEGPVLGSHPVCAELAAAVVHPGDSPGVRLLGLATDFLPVETLPPAVRGRLGLRSTASTRLRMRLFRRVAPAVFPHLADRWRCYPEYLRAIDDPGNRADGRAGRG